METGNGVRLMPLGDTERSLGRQQDLRGRRVFDRSGEEIGNITELLLDEREGQIRLIVVTADHLPGAGERAFALPVDAIDRLEPDRLFIDQMRERVLSAPLYDPTVTPPLECWGGLFNYYGYEPFWTPG